VSFLSLQDFQKSSPGCVTAVRKAFQQIKDLCLRGGKEGQPRSKQSQPRGKKVDSGLLQLGLPLAQLNQCKRPLGRLFLLAGLIFDVMNSFR